MYLLENPIRGYEWGSPTLIQQLLGRPIDGEVMAEVWIGAHPDDPSEAVSVGHQVPLDQLIAASPDNALGSSVAKRFDNRLPYLVKFLAAAKGLSIQVHPTTEQAREGYARENQAGVGLDDPTRTYRDASHKPEILYSLTHMELLSGLREPEQAAKLIESLDVDALSPLVRELRGGSNPERCMRDAFAWLLAERGNATWVQQVAERAALLRGGRPEMAAVSELARQYPGDPGIVAPLIMNYEQIRPGQVIFTGAGTLHAYLRGMALEVMGASDNVLRAALTSKHVDKEGVLEISSFRPGLAAFAVGNEISPGRRDYRIDGIPDFAMQIITVQGGEELSGPVSGPRVAVCLQGTTVVRTVDKQQLDAGQAVFVPATEGAVRISGSGVAAVIYVPEGSQPSL